MGTKTATLYPASYDTTRTKYASVNSSYPLSNPIGKPSSNTTYAQWDLTTGSSAESYVYYKFDCSEIPADATIDGISCSAKAYVNQTNSSRIATRNIQLYANTTAKGSASTISTSTTALNMTCGTWTRSELNNCYIRIYVKRGTSNTTTTYYARFYGATLTITYTYQDVTYTVTSSLNGDGTIEPNGSQSVIEGEDYNLVIKPTSDLSTVTVTDNGTDVTNKLTDLSSGHVFSVATKSGATYGFQQNYDANCRSGWWQSTNKGKATSASVATVSFNVKQTTTVIVRLICYAESTYDYMLISAMDGELATGASADSNAAFTTKNSNSQNEQTYVFNNVAAGDHHFDVKYYKDSYTDSNWDSAQFTVEFEPGNGEIIGKQYTITDVRAAHTIVVNISSPSGTGVYLKQNGAWKEAIAIYKKVNGAWVLQNGNYQTSITDNFKLN